MGDSFDRVFENREVNGTKTKLAILAELTPLLRTRSREPQSNPNLFVVKPLDTGEDEGDDWEGTIKKLTRVFERQGQSIQRRLGSKSDRIFEAIEESSKKEIIADRVLRAHIDSCVKT